MRNQVRIAGLAAMIAAATIAQAGNTFTVTVASSTVNNPWGGAAFPQVFYVDGVECPALTLTRGESYIFQMSGTPSIHPFIVTTTASGGAGAVLYNDGVAGQNATGNAQLTFSVQPTAPDQLYYACHNHANMGWQLNIVDPPCVGDLTGDLMIDLDDLSIVLVNFGITSGATPEQGDFDGDGDIDLDDLSTLLVVFGTSCN